MAEIRPEGAGLPELIFASAHQWERWLEDHWSQPHGVWLKIAKKGASTGTVSYAEALEVALCYGWIDGQKRPFDGEYWLQKFTRRRARSAWSRINTEKVLALIEAGRMQAPGMAEVEAARQDGRWNAAYTPQSRASVPTDFQEELDKHPEAAAFFDTLNKLNRYALCLRIETAKRSETRRARITKFVAMLNRGERPYP